MSSLVLLFLCLVPVFDCSTVFLANNNNSLLKSVNMLPIPVGMAPAVVESIAKGAEIALEYCQDIFKWERWNCPRSSFFRLSKQQPNREIALSKAILAAGIVHTITKDCSSGEIPDCGCDPDLGPPSVLTDLNHLKLNNPLFLYNSSEGLVKRSSDWSWGGCSDDPRFAMKVTKKVLHGLDKGTDASAYVSRHNSKVGRELILDTMMRKCRCHGISGSCSMQTCWMQVAPFKEVSRRLKEKYKKAERLTQEAVEKSVSLGNSARELTEEKVIPVKRNSLVYLVQSPDYCVVNAAEDLPGTKGRTCSRNTSKSALPSEKKSCRTLCRNCGYRVKKIKKTETKKCNCKFVWCCEVKCDTCVVDVEEHFCY